MSVSVALDEAGSGRRGSAGVSTSGNRSRGNATVAAVLLVAVAIALAGVVGAVALDAVPETPPPQAAFEVEADAVADSIVLTHLGGDPVDVRRLNLRVRVDGDPLARQPPVPFFAATGFRGGPTGPFNSAADARWTAGERAGFRVASTNEPPLVPGATVTVVLVVDGTTVARLTATA